MSLMPTWAPLRFLFELINEFFISTSFQLVFFSSNLTSSLNSVIPHFISLLEHIHILFEVLNMVIIIMLNYLFGIFFLVISIMVIIMGLAIFGRVMLFWIILLFLSGG